jgi:hypothetical protein
MQTYVRVDRPGEDRDRMEELRRDLGAQGCFSLQLDG